MALGGGFGQGGFGGQNGVNGQGGFGGPGGANGQGGFGGPGYNGQQGGPGAPGFGGPGGPGYNGQQGGPGGPGYYGQQGGPGGANGQGGYGGQGSFGGGFSGQSGPVPGLTEKKSFDGILLLVSVIGGLLGGIAAMLIYDLMLGRTENRALVVTLSVAGFFLIYGLVILLVQWLVRGTYPRNASMGLMILIFVISAVLISGLTYLFEYIYEDHGTFVNKTGPTSYIFVIDDSSSMSWDDRDPQRVRYDAVDQILAGKGADFPYAVYSFSDTATCLRPFGPKGSSSNVRALAPEKLGGTNYQVALAAVGDDFESGEISDDKNPRVLFLSDGEYSYDISDQLEPFIERGIAISTVGLASERDAIPFEKLQEIADLTGGTFAYVDDIEMLAGEMGSAINTEVSRDLLTERTGNNEDDGKYALLRILFMALIGFAAGAAVALFGGIEEKVLPILTSVATGALGGVILELGCRSDFFRNLSLPIPGSGLRLVDYLYFLVIAMTFATIIHRVGTGLPGQELYMNNGTPINAKGFGQDDSQGPQGPAKTFGGF